MSSLAVDRCEFSVGDVIANRYTVSSVLGEGSFGKVYRVTDSSHTLYALKLLRLWDVHPDLRQPLMGRFEMEFKTGQIDCDYLVRSYDYGVIGGNPFIVMEYCDGGDLTPYLGTGKGNVALIMRQILLGLHALHINGKVHRDLKPENVLFKRNNIAALTDFGICGDRNKRMTERNIFGKPTQMFGTYAYMPPEQVNRVRGEATVLPTTDIFSFGVLAYQLLTGKLPFGKLESHNDLAEYHKRGKDGLWDRSVLRALPDGSVWSNLIGACLEPKFKNRIQSVKEVLAMLPNFQSEPVMQIQQSAIKCEKHDGCILRVMHGDEYGKIFSLTNMLNESNRNLLTVGRLQENDIVLQEIYNSYISRKHCTIESNENRTMWYLRDGQWDARTRNWDLSSNGTFVNSSQVGQEGIRLKMGDIITIGDMKLRFEIN